MLDVKGPLFSDHILNKGVRGPIFFSTFWKWVCGDRPKFINFSSVKRKKLVGPRTKTVGPRNTPAQKHVKKIGPCTTQKLKTWLSLWLNSLLRNHMIFPLLIVMKTKQLNLLNSNFICDTFEYELIDKRR